MILKETNTRGQILLARMLLENDITLCYNLHEHGRGAYLHATTFSNLVLSYVTTTNVVGVFIICYTVHVDRVYDASIHLH